MCLDGVLFVCSVLEGLSRKKSWPSLRIYVRNRAPFEPNDLSQLVC
jgi:hypothetical protein